MVTPPRTTDADVGHEVLRSLGACDGDALGTLEGAIDGVALGALVLKAFLLGGHGTVDLPPRVQLVSEAVPLGRFSPEAGSAEIIAKSISSPIDHLLLADELDLEMRRPRA